VTTAVLAGGVVPAAAESEQAAAAKAVVGRMLEAPRAKALVTRLPLRVAVRVPARTSRLRVRVGGRNVTARFRRRGGSLRVARLSRPDGLRYGRNHLVVLAQRRGRRPVLEARSFVLARRDPGLVRLRLRRGPVTSLRVRVAGGVRLAPEHFDRPKELARRLSVIRRERTVRLWLNGRRITRALDKSQQTRLSASLSASHGLRYGVNRLRIQVVEPDRGRYAMLTRRFVIRRNRNLAAAGWDAATRAGAGVRLDGRRSRTIGGGGAHYRWRIVSKPRGSRTKLRRRSSGRPLLTPDRPGRYVVSLMVRARTRRATASQASRAGTDRVVLTAGPSSLLLPFKGQGIENGHFGIRVGDAFYHNNSPTGAYMQWLTLDRKTLTPIDPVTRRPSEGGNTWIDPSADGVEKLTNALAKQDVDQLVILAFPGFGANFPAAVPADQVAKFNAALKTIGVGPIDPTVFTQQSGGEWQEFAIVGVPNSGDGSGQYAATFKNEDLLTGWLMPDALKAADAFRFRFQPERPVFDTSSSHTDTTNTMTVRDQHVDAVLPDGTADPLLRSSAGFQVVKLDPIHFTPVDSAVFATNYINQEQNGYGY